MFGAPLSVICILRKHYSHEAPSVAKVNGALIKRMYGNLICEVPNMY